MGDASTICGRSFFARSLPPSSHSHQSLAHLVPVPTFEPSADLAGSVVLVRRYFRRDDGLLLEVKRRRAVQEVKIAILLSRRASLVCPPPLAAGVFLPAFGDVRETGHDPQ